MPTGVQLFNVIRETLSPQFKDRVPAASDANFREIGTMITRGEMQVYANEWLTALINRIGLTLFHDKMLRNKLAPFKKGTLEYGDIIEEIIVEPAAAKIYKGPELYDEDTICLPNPYCKEKPDVRTQYHRRNRQEFYKTTIFRETLKKAFTGPGGLQTLVDAIVQSLYKGANMDEYLWMKELFSEYIFNPKIPLAPQQLVTIDPIDDNDSAMAYINSVKSYIELLSFNSTNFNPSGITTYSEPGQMHLFVKAGILPFIQTYTYTGAFNQTYLETGVPITVVDNFGTLDDGTVDAVLADNRWWMVYDNLREFTSKFNEEGLYWNYWLHIWQTYATSYFMNAIIFRETVPTP